MVYEYHCDTCEKSFDVVKRAKEYDTEELCSTCNNPARRHFAPSRVYFSGTKVEDAEYNPGLGCITKSKSHRNEIAKVKGVEEIGNEKPESLHKHFDQARKDKWDSSWAQADKGWVGEEG